MLTGCLTARLYSVLLNRQAIFMMFQEGNAPPSRRVVICDRSHKEISGEKSLARFVTSRCSAQILRAEVGEGVHIVLHCCWHYTRVDDTIISEDVGPLTSMCAWIVSLTCCVRRPSHVRHGPIPTLLQKVQPTSALGLAIAMKSRNYASMDKCISHAYTNASIPH
ncbi:uncharacterized protein P174DRAFT_254236 [Aspergillus novofumigatus IBT 16806]|uniref:Uncharacterized protein n=1 Tax=Aspergillus novofumigatus (strain IBT 16806) TaxID=1392255 RepID=A0A2I1C2P2_ASPN1|nr:uncharacterized protein P174DRAFT_254236 [Aspergillus novofumigatus IBT 16806]PKX91914.1 hypothetical protein P174DRAFT_254236 [Aspergillus novofumigatus IBT 16806]